MFTKDIHGNEWSPCKNCPSIDPGKCPSRRHRAYCDHIKENYDAWYSVIRNEPIETRGPIERNVIGSGPITEQTETVQANAVFHAMETEKQTSVNPRTVSIKEIRELINSCDYRGPVVSEGCQCTRICWMRKGQCNDEPFGKVKDRDCWDCVTTNKVESQIGETNQKTRDNVTENSQKT